MLSVGYRNVTIAIVYSNARCGLYRRCSVICTLADLGFFRGGDFGNPSERSERALRDLARGGAQNDVEIT